MRRRELCPEDRVCGWAHQQNRGVYRSLQRRRESVWSLCHSAERWEAGPGQHPSQQLEQRVQSARRVTLRFLLTV